MNDAAKTSIHCFISGKVQGVWFRANTKKEADKLGLKGWVRNLADGRVEVMASGSKDKIEQLLAWLQRGPERAQVTECHSEEVIWQSFETFEVT
jgi:acylphosphatase